MDAVQIYLWPRNLKDRSATSPLFMSHDAPEGVRVKLMDRGPVLQVCNLMS